MIVDRFEEHLKERMAQNYATTRRWSSGQERVGMIGECALAIFFCAEPDQRNKPRGDKGGDQWVLLDFGRGPRWFLADSKAARKPIELLVPKKTLEDGANKDTIYTLVGPSGDSYECLRFEWGEEMSRQPLEQWSGNDRWVHHKKQYLCQQMDRLKEAYCGQWRWHEPDGRPGEIRNALPQEEVREWQEALKTHLTEPTDSPKHVLPQAPDRQTESFG